MTAEIADNRAGSVCARPGRARLPSWVPVAAIIVILVARVAFSLLVPPNEDEAYYFAWGQHLQLSYYDHAPLHGWMQGLSTAIFGWSHWAMRAMSFVTLAATAAIFWYWAGRLAPLDRVNFFLTSLAIYMASPVVFAISVLAFPDHWLMFLSLASTHFFALFFAERLEGRRGLYRFLYAGAALLGLAALAKYNAVVLGLAVAAFIVFDRRLRPLLREPQLYLAALLSVAMLAPVLIWNLQNDFASIRYQLYGRYAPGGPGVMGEFSLERFGVFVLTSAVYVSPFVVIPLLRLLFSRKQGDFGGALGGIATWTFICSSLIIGYIAFFARAAVHWNILAFLALLPLAALHFRWRVALAGHLLLGTAAIVILAGYFVTFPALQDSPQGDREAARVYGWEQVSARMEELRREHGAAALASIYYGGASKIAFAAGPGAVVTTLASAHDSFDEWRDEAGLKGRDIVIHDEWGHIDRVADQFETIEDLGTIEVSRFGKTIIVYALHLGRGYRGLED